jgi:hypothetical protein
MKRTRDAELGARGRGSRTEEIGTWLRHRTCPAASVDVARAEQREVDAPVMATEQATWWHGSDDRRGDGKEE